MKKAIFTLVDDKKINFIESLKGNVLVVYPKSSQHLLGSFKGEKILTDDLKKSVRFLNFQTRINKDTTLVILDCLRYKTWNNTIYNRIYTLTSNSSNTIVLDDFPFVFDNRNIFVSMKMLGKELYHPNQFYDDNFFIEKDGKNIKANSLDSIYDTIKEYVYCDTEKIRYLVHDWNNTEAEKEEYDKYKYRKIMVEKVSKMKAVTGCTGRSNRMESKQKALRSLLNTIQSNPVIVYNWDKGIKDCKIRFGDGVKPISYHQETNAESEDIIFLETIISQKIKFYKKLKQYHKSSVHFFINKNIGADKMVNTEVIKIVNDLNQFYGKTWKSL